jgi:LacI family transcriptional regulator/LacI family repressor for deo operon, udp, cdd, tsx, nupC, and nupG
MANIRDVAKEAGTSIATVSRILSNDSSFETTEKTRQNVLGAVKRLGYSVKTAKKTQKKIHLGCILALTAEKYSDPFFTSILSAAEEECVSHNALISVIRNYNELENPAVLSEICSFGLSGLILMEALPDSMLRQLKASIPHIIAVDLPTADFNTVGFDNYESSLQVMNCLIDHGYRRIAYIGGSSPGMNFDCSPRMAIYREVLYRNGIAFDPALALNCSWDLDQCAECAAKLFSLDNPPEVIFAGSDTLASIILSVMHKMGLRCPQDVGVIGFNNIAMSSLMAPPLSTINIPTKDIGAAAVQRLMDMIGGRDNRIMKIQFPTQIILRESLLQKESGR